MFNNIKKKITTITILTLSIILVSLYVVTSTYSLIIEVIDKDGNSEIINDITIRDLLTNDDGTYNETYYDVFNELAITPNEADILMDSIPLNEALNTIVNNLIDYKFNGKERFSNNELYNLIVLSTMSDDTIDTNLKDIVISKTNTYIDDIADYLYGLKTVKRGENA